MYFETVSVDKVRVKLNIYKSIEMNQNRMGLCSI